MMRRREFITLLGGAAAWPRAARAQQGERMRRIGLLMGTADDREGQARVTALKQGLQELGWTDGGNIQIETRFGGADAARIRAHAAELAALAPDVIIGQTTPVIRALRQVTSSIPIIMASVNDPVEQGFVSSLAHPGGNITGFALIRFPNGGEVAGDAQRDRPQRYSRGAHVQPRYIPPLLRLPAFVRGHAAVSRG
jgi:putative ABC transport system substrate-binding protein